MHNGDKKEQPATPQESNPETTPAASASNTPQPDSSTQQDDATEGDYVVVGSGLGIDE